MGEMKFIAKTVTIRYEDTPEQLLIKNQVALSKLDCYIDNMIVNNSDDKAYTVIQVILLL